MQLPGAVSILQNACALVRAYVSVLILKYCNIHHGYLFSEQTKEASSLCLETYPCGSQQGLLHLLRMMAGEQYNINYCFACSVTHLAACTALLSSTNRGHVCRLLLCVSTCATFWDTG